MVQEQSYVTSTFFLARLEMSFFISEFFSMVFILICSLVSFTMKLCFTKSILANIHEIFNFLLSSNRKKKKHLSLRKTMPMQWLLPTMLQILPRTQCYQPSPRVLQLQNPTRQNQKRSHKKQRRRSTVLAKLTECLE